jgi:von Willebrand factor type A domain
LIFPRFITCLLLVVLFSMDVFADAFRDTTVKKRDAQIVFLLDISNSMARDNKMKLLKNSSAELMKLLDKDDMISLMTFGDQVNIVYHTTSYPGPDSLLKVISKVRSTASATNINGGIFDAYELIKTSSKSKGAKAKRGEKKRIKSGQPADYMSRDNHVLLITDGLFELNAFSKELVCEHPGIQLTCVVVGKGLAAEEAVRYVREELQLRVITLIDEEKDISKLTEIFEQK